MKHQLRNRLESNKWHKLTIVEWYKSGKAVRVLMGNFKVNLPLVTEFVKIINGDYVNVWGEFANKRADDNIRSYYQYRQRVKGPGGFPAERSVF